MRLILLLFIILVKGVIFFINSDNVGNNTCEIRYFQKAGFLPISYKLDLSVFNLLLMQFEKLFKLRFLIFSLLCKN